MTLRVLDIFSGIGGFSLGLERAGMRTVAFCEIDPYCRALLADRWPGVPIHEDVQTLRGSDVGPVDVICGGFPCQDISTAGKGAGLTGERSGLWGEYRRLIEELRPSWVIIENVSVLRSRGLDQMLGEITALGYDAEWHCIPASAVGAPHQRDRIWILAYPASQRSQRDGAAGLEEPHLPPRQVLSRCDGAGTGAAHWATEPAVGRLVDGFPSRMDPAWCGPIKALGNAVVPQIPEAIGRAIVMLTE